LQHEFVHETRSPCILFRSTLDLQLGAKLHQPMSVDNQTSQTRAVAASMNVMTFLGWIVRIMSCTSRYGVHIMLVATRPDLDETMEDHNYAYDKTRHGLRTMRATKNMY
jgi:hypothetical protein